MKRLVYKSVISLLLIIALLAIGPWCFKRTQELRETYSEHCTKKRMHKDDNRISRIGQVHGNCKWNSYSVIAHGGGGIDGKCCSNSLESLNLAYLNGTRLFDVDINYTSDSVMILRHSWNDNTEQTGEPHLFSNETKHKELGMFYYSLKSHGDILDSTQFSKHKIFSLYHPLTFRDFIDWMCNHPDAYMLPDFKGDIPVQLIKLLQIVKESGHNDLLERLVVRIREYSEYEEVAKLIPSNQIMLRKYNTTDTSYGELLEFCVNNNIHALALTQKRTDDDIIVEFEKRGVKIYVGVVDYISDYKFFKKKGASGIVSNFIYENQLKYGI